MGIIGTQGSVKYRRERLVEKPRGGDLTAMRLVLEGAFPVRDPMVSELMEEIEELRRMINEGPAAGADPETVALLEEVEELRRVVREQGWCNEPQARAQRAAAWRAGLHVEPIFLQRCVMCHSDAAQQDPPERLRLDSCENFIRGAERVVVLPGRPQASEVVRRIEGTAQPRMPFNGPPWLVRISFG